MRDNRCHYFHHVADLNIHHVLALYVDMGQHINANFSDLPPSFQCSTGAHIGTITNRRSA